MFSYCIHFFTIIGLVLIFTTGDSRAKSCLSFSSPSSEVPVIISSPCTLTIAAQRCKSSIKNVEFAARYYPEQSDTSTVIILDTITKKPFSVVWDISKIPNQVFRGATIYADALFYNGKVSSIRKEQVFCIHQPVARHEYAVQYNFSGIKKITGTPLKLIPYNDFFAAKAAVYWNEKELVIICDVHYPGFSSTMSGINNIGVEVALDPMKSRKPFPGDDVFLYTVPLHGKPFRTIYTSTIDDMGVTNIGVKTKICVFPCAITKHEKEGFEVYFAVPISLFDNRFPETIGFNIAVKTIEPEGDIKKLYWIKPSSSHDFYSPYTWGELQLKQRPLLMNRLLIGLIGFGAGFLVTLIITSLIIFIRRPGKYTASAQSEADYQQFLLIKPDFDSFITDKGITLERMSKVVNIPSKKFALLIKNATGMSFNMYVAYSRIEIAKERLRSSHANEDSIAAACGFSSVGEMEKQFIRFCKSTPAKFRSEQQVA